MSGNLVNVIKMYPESTVLGSKKNYVAFLCTKLGKNEIIKEREVAGYIETFECCSAVS